MTSERKRGFGFRRLDRAVVQRFALIRQQDSIEIYGLLKVLAKMRARATRIGEGKQPRLRSW
jgi:hypothetical protein